MLKVIAAVVASDPGKYTEAFLGKPNNEYCAWIQDPDKWGGECSVTFCQRSTAKCEILKIHLLLSFCFLAYYVFISLLVIHAIITSFNTVRNTTAMFMK